MIWFFYNLLFVAVFILLTPHFFMRMTRRGGYSNGFLQRIGKYDEGVLRFDESSERIWIHAVSVGEMFVALKLMELIRERQPAVCFIVSVTTSTGHTVAQDRISGRDSVIYFPVDFPWVMRRVLNRLKPSRILLVEGEMWPNLIRLASARSISVGMINGRLSESSFKGYRRLGWVTRRIFPLIDTICMQGDLERDRMIQLGADPERTFALGSAKFDVADSQAIDSSTARSVLDQFGATSEQLVFLGGSTWAGEETQLVEIYKTLLEKIPHVRLVLVPRHAERCGALIRELDELGCPWVRRSSLPESVPEGAVLLVDTTGELMQFYQEADVVFVGKSLCEKGGQNPLEPASLGKAVVVGPNMQNFPSVMNLLLADEAILQVEDSSQLQEQLLYLLASEDERKALGDRAAESVVKHRGVLNQTLDHLGIPS